MSDPWLKLPLGVVDDTGVAKDTIELPPGSLDSGVLAGLGFAWVQPPNKVDDGRVLALSLRNAALPEGATVPASLAGAMGLKGEVWLRTPTRRELRRSRKADVVAFYTALLPAIATLVVASVSTTLTGTRFWIALACWLVIFLSSAYLAWTRWRSLRKNSR